MKNTEIIKKARVEKGYDYQYMADKLGITFDSYRDLETYEDEYTDCIDLNKFISLCAILNIVIESILNLPSYPKFCDVNAVKILVDKVLKKKKDIKIFENEEVGWTFYKNITNIEEMRKYPIMFFEDLGKALNENWTELIYPYIKDI